MIRQPAARGLVPSTIRRCGLSLGSNQGDRLYFLRTAVQAVELLADFSQPVLKSSIFETDAVGCAPGTPPFLNAVMEIGFFGEPESLLERLRAVEAALGRPPDRAKNDPRSIDLDLLYADDLTVHSATLDLPHPRWAQRRFVVEPLAEIRPGLRLPGQKQTVGELLAAWPLEDPPPKRIAGDLRTMRNRFIALKLGGHPLATLTAADYPTARLLDEAGLDLILVGDSLGMVELGYVDTTEVTLDDMLHHTRAVRRGVTRTPLAADLPFRTYDTPVQALATARDLMEAGADAVKLEGGCSHLPQVAAILKAGIPLIGHIGMLPQNVREEGGYKKKGKTVEQAEGLIADARALDAAGVAAIVVEDVVASVAGEISRAVECPTIGIGSGSGCDGQILVTADLIGAFPWFRPPFARARADVAGEVVRAVAEYVSVVRSAGG